MSANLPRCAYSSDRHPGPDATRSRHTDTTCLIGADAHAKGRRKPICERGQTPPELEVSLIPAMRRIFVSGVMPSDRFR